MVDAVERLNVLLTQEDVSYRTLDYLGRLRHLANEELASAGEPMDSDASSPPSPKKRKGADGEYTEVNAQGERCRGPPTSVINKHWREKICEWAYQVVDHFQLQREVVSIAMNHLDRYLADYPFTVDKNKFQLLAMTCLYLSIKLNVYKHLLIPGSKSTMDSILQLSRGFFTLTEMEEMENDILQRLQWHVHPPSPQAFVKHFLYLIGIEDTELLDVSQFMVELSIMDYYFVDYKSSEVAIASIMNALQRRSPNDKDKAPIHDEYYPNLMGPVPRSLFDYDTSKVRECRDRLHLIFMQANGHVPAAAEEGDRTPRKAESDAIRTTSPVSVMTPMS
ncbi:unnamed protein product [Cylindrotheca closterium]|uniref:Cyclin-like domain-containing protein n=1 Tax=Cylindrotheca closterium TaxID=2856 RepID=A0AAD2CK31_9STRA|nr:unnamed protein product [Cylindrotheca closterium]